MKTINRSSNRRLKTTILKAIRLVGVCVTVAVIAFIVIQWMTAQKEEGFSIESSSNNKASVDSMVERNKASNDQEAGKSDNVLNTEKSKRDGTEAVVTKRSATPDELIFGMSQSELDAFHKRQMLSISGTLSNPETKIKLPPSDDKLPAMTLHELDVLHKQQTMAFEKRPIEFVQPSDGGTSESKHAVMSLEELDLMHREQVIQSKLSANDLVNLPQISAENELRPLTAGQLDEMISRQTLAAEFNEVDHTKPIVVPPSSDGPHTLTNWGLIELHSQQEKLIKE
jgi:hypothetical protein